MNSATESSSSGRTVLRDDWNQAAKEFYSVSALAKMDPVRYEKFASAYRRVGDLLGVSGNSAVLDVGCGCGELAKAIVPLVGSYCGVDISPESIVLARERNPGARFIESDAAAGLPEGPFDCAAAITSIEFCYDKGKVLREIGRVVKQGGRFYLEVRNGSFPLARMPDSVRNLFERLGVLSPYPAPGFRDLLYMEWKTLIDEAGFDVVSVARLCRPVFYGNAMMRIRNAVIRLMNSFLPVRLHYMVGFVCRKRDVSL